MFDFVSILVIFSRTMKRSQSLVQIMVNVLSHRRFKNLFSMVIDTKCVSFYNIFMVLTKKFFRHFQKIVRHDFSVIRFLELILPKILRQTRTIAIARHWKFKIFIWDCDGICSDKWSEQNEWNVFSFIFSSDLFYF